VFRLESTVQQMLEVAMRGEGTASRRVNGGTWSLVWLIVLGLLAGTIQGRAHSPSDYQDGESRDSNDRDDDDNDNDNDNELIRPGRVFPRKAKPYGMTLGEWQARDWHVFLQFTPYDPTTCVIGLTTFETAQVVHLNASAGAPLDVECTLTSKQSLSLNVVTYGAFPFVDCPGPCSPPELEAIARAFIAGATDLRVELDGEPVRDLRGRVVNWFRHRHVSPVFSTVGQPGNVFDAFNLVGSVGPAVSVGYTGIMTPLTPGHHTLTVLAAFAPIFEIQNTYHITVTE
jgi:hypothetical protein